MTAEIAVLNRYAVALAADSAVTIGDGSTTKIFQSENKLFQLSEDQPIGIMLYNATSHYGIPWELIIKDFREKHKEFRAEVLFNIVPRFVEFLQTAYLPSSDQQSRLVRAALLEEFSAVRARFSDELLQTSLHNATRKNVDKAARFLFNLVVDDAINARQVWDMLDESGLKNALSILLIYEDVFQFALDRAFGGLPLEENEKIKLRELAARTTISTKPGSNTTGLVFAGFGTKELFPSLFCMEIYGVVNDALLKVELESIDIDRAATTGAVVPFAQREAADSLLYGRSDTYEDIVTQHFSDVVEQIGNAIVDVSTRGKKKQVKLKERVRAARDEAIKRFRDKVSPQIKDDLFQDILDTIRHMPKQELASFAEALVSVTSIKRKISVGPETVGGPIDVAVISRHEGFVWVKRKLYFPAELNPRFAWRMRRAHHADKGRDAGITEGRASTHELGTDDGPTRR